MLYMWKMCGLKVLLSHRVTGLGNWQFFARDGALEKVKTKTLTFRTGTTFDTIRSHKTSNKQLIDHKSEQWLYQLTMESYHIWRACTVKTNSQVLDRDDTWKPNTLSAHWCESKTVSPHQPEQRFLQRYYSQQTKPVLSAGLYQLDDAQLRTEDSIKHNQQEKDTCAYGVRKHLVLWVYTVCAHFKKQNKTLLTYTLTPTLNILW